MKQFSNSLSRGLMQIVGRVIFILKISLERKRPNADQRGYHINCEY